MMISPTGEMDWNSVDRSQKFFDATGAGGFSLLELILIMALFGAILSMAAPNLRGFLSARETEKAAERIITLTRLARSRAISQGRVFRLKIDAVENSYWLERQEGEQFEEVTDAFGGVHYLPVSVVFERVEPAEIAGRGYITFCPTGRVDVATLYLRGRRDELVSLRCDSPTDKFRITVLE